MSMESDKPDIGEGEFRPWERFLLRIVMWTWLAIGLLAFVKRTFIDG